MPTSATADFGDVEATALPAFADRLDPQIR